MGHEADGQVQNYQEPQIVIEQRHPLEDLDRSEPRRDHADAAQRTRSGRCIKLPERFRDFDMS
jgi:hypothetical protein